MKYAFITENRQQHSIKRMCCVLGVSSSGYYDWRKRKPSVRMRENTNILKEIQRIHIEVMETYGSPRMHVELLDRGYRLSRGRVERIMSFHGIQAKQSKRHRRTYIHREGQQPEPNLLNRQFRAKRPNQKWVSDITFIETNQGWLYLAIVLDLFSRAIIGWSMSDRPSSQLVLDAVSMAYQSRQEPSGTIVHSDQGSQYTAANYRAKLAHQNMICSMSRKGKCHDNAVAESFFHTLKNELVFDARYRTRSEARQAIFKYIELFYNRKRRHSYLNYKAPLEYERINAAA
ncbi:MAG: IS3 family transposase [Candidatus Thiodiazotropha sp.]